MYSIKDIMKSPKSCAFQIHATIISRIVAVEKPKDRKGFVVELMRKSVKELLLDYSMQLWIPPL